MRYLKEAWLVIVLSVVFGGALAGVQAALSQRIAKNQLEDIQGQIPGLLLSSPDPLRKIEAGERIEIKGDSGKGPSLVAFPAMENGRLAGWGLLGRGQGFADILQLLIGVDAEARTITGLYVLDQRETPGLGDEIRKPKFRDSFRGRQADQTLVAVKRESRAGNEIQAVSGATISSASVCEIVNETVRRFRENLGKFKEQMEKKGGG